MENKVAVYTKTGYSKITYFNIVTFSAGESKVIKRCVSYAIVSKTFWAQYIVLSYGCKKSISH